MTRTRSKPGSRAWAIFRENPLETLYKLRHITGAVLSPLLDFLSGFGPVWFASFLALFSSFGILIVYRACSSAGNFQKAKNRVKAHLLELRLFQEDPALVARAALGVVRANLRYLRMHAKPLAVFILPVSLILLEGEARLDRRCFLPGEAIIVQSFWPQHGLTGLGEQIEIVVAPGLVVESPPLRIPGQKEIDWRLRAKLAGVHRVAVRSPLGQGFVDVSVSDELGAPPGSAGRSDHTEATAGAPLLRVEHPKSFLALGSFRVPWLWVLVSETFLFVLAFKGRFGVEL